jgi:hypothetical protein
VHTHPRGRRCPLPAANGEGTMATEEQQRHALHGRLAKLLGNDEAATLMGYLPPGGWADVATRRDLDGVRVQVDGLRREVDSLRRDLEGLRREVGELRTEVRDLGRDLVTLRQDLTAQGRTFTLATSASILTTASLAFAAARFV